MDWKQKCSLKIEGKNEPYPWRDLQALLWLLHWVEGLGDEAATSVCALLHSDKTCLLKSVARCTPKRFMKSSTKNHTCEKSKLKQTL